MADDTSHGGDETSRDDDGGLSERLAILISAVVGFVVAIGSVLLVTWVDVTHEELFRVSPTVEGGGVGADWVAGASDSTLKLLITIIHLADVVLGLFILVMVFIHWAAFRRLATRMRSGTESADDRVAADGGERQ